jgi:hypothetical protein
MRSVERTCYFAHYKLDSEALLCQIALLWIYGGWLGGWNVIDWAHLEFMWLIRDVMSFFFEFHLFCSVSFLFGLGFIMKGSELINGRELKKEELCGYFLNCVVWIGKFCYPLENFAKKNSIPKIGFNILKSCEFWTLKTSLQIIEFYKYL